VRVLEDSAQHVGKTYDLGNDCLDGNEIAAAFSAAVGQPMTYSCPNKYLLQVSRNAPL
jgi:uncharacterized protein YbjT (DUF2867 family)